MTPENPLSVLLLSLLLSGLAAVFPQDALAADDEPLPLEGKTESLSFSTEAGSWMSLDVLPDGETFVFDLLGDIFSLPIGGGEASRITSGLGFDSQPVVSPDGSMLAFISDRSGSNNLWVSDIDGSNPRRLSNEKHQGLISPAWTPDGRFIVVTRRAKDNELVTYHIAGGSGVTLSGPDKDTKVWGVGVEASPDGRFLYMAAPADSNGPVDDFPTAQISRYDRHSGHLDQLTRAEGGAFRPVVSPDGQKLVYGTRDDGQTGLRIRDLLTGDDRWLAYPVQPDAQENWRPPSRDTLPGYSFTPDGRSVVFNAGGGFFIVDVASGERRSIPFRADVNLDVGPDLTAGYRVEQGPLTATLIHDPKPSPDNERIAASVLTKIYLTDRDGGAPRRLTASDALEYKPTWSPDGRWIAYVTWHAEDGGHIWRARSNGRGRPERLTDFPAYYTDLVYSPDGDRIYAMRGNGYMRNQTFSEFTGLGIPLELVSLPADGGDQTMILPAREARNPHFGAEPDRIYLYDDKELFSVALGGGDRRSELVVSGPEGNRPAEEPPRAELVTLSPAGDHALAFVNKQVWLIPVTPGGGTAPVVKVRSPALPAARLTDVGADFLGWSADGQRIHWAIGNTWFERPLASVEFTDATTNDDADDEETETPDQPFVPRDEHESVTALQIDVTVPRNTPSGSILLRGANLLPMRGTTLDELDDVLSDQDLLVVDNRITAIGDSGSLAVDDDVHVVDMRGKYILPGFIDTHAHWEFRTGDVLEPHNWSLVANLAYGVTAGLDVQTAYKDYLAYRDFQSTGQSVGQRAFMVARGIFGNNDFQSYDETHAYLRRYKEHYHTNNIKAYLTGNRRQRQWVALASQDLGLMPTTEGGGDQKLDITHAIDGMHGNEHNLPDIPIFDDVVQLYARTQTAYTPTLIVQYNAERMREYFFTRSDVHGNEKLRRF